MKTNIFKKIIMTTALATGLVACGDDPALIGNTTNGVAGFCSIPAGVKDRTVIGNLGNGATLRLDIYSTPSGSIAAQGELIVPSIESLYGIDGGIYNNTYTGPQSQFRTCVSSMNFVGNLERDLSYQEITLTLYGDNNTYIEMGETVGPYTAVLVGDALEGNIKLRIGSFEQRTFLLTR
jgi:hypothetical protein